MTSSRETEPKPSETDVIVRRMGQERLSKLQLAIGRHAGGDAVPLVVNVIDELVERERKKGREDTLRELGYATIADSLSELTSKRSVRRLLGRGITIRAAVEAHNRRAEQAAAEQSKTLLRERGVTGTPLIYDDNPNSGLLLVRLINSEQCLYEGVCLLNCLANKLTTRDYLDRGALLYSLREEGTIPRATIEVDPSISAIVQARGCRNKQLDRDSPEYGALERSLDSLAAHVTKIAGVSVPALSIND